MNTELPSIYEYNDFRKFIADYQKYMHQQDHTYTKSRMSKLLGLPNSRSYLTDVLNGKKVTQIFVERFIQLFAFKHDEANYFRVLVQFNQSENPNERELYFEQLIAFNKTPKKYLYEQSYRYYKEWYNAAIRAILNVYDFDGKNYSALAKTLIPSITAVQAKTAVKLLLELNLLEKNDDGFLKPTSKSISTEEYVQNEIIKQYQIKCLECAKNALISKTQPQGLIATNTISVSERGRQRIEKQIERFRSQVRSLVQKDEDSAESVYHMDILFFSMMKKDA